MTDDWQTHQEFHPGANYDIPMVSHFEFPSLVKTLTSGPDPVAIAKQQATNFSYEICLEADFDTSHDVVDTIPAEFDGVSTAGCGTHYFVVPQHPNGKPRPLEPERLEWDPAGCDNTQDKCLVVVVATDKNPGKRGGKANAIWEPTSCGSLDLNDGASLVDAQGTLVEGPSNVLTVATCDAQVNAVCEGDEGDADLDRWTASCGDCDDGDAGQYPGAAVSCNVWNPDEVLEDDDCDGIVDFPTVGDVCDNGEVCLREGVIVCTTDGTGTRCNAPTNVSPGLYGEECQNGVDDDCDGADDEHECCSWVGSGIPCVTNADCCCGTPESLGCGGIVYQTCGPNNLCTFGN